MQADPKAMMLACLYLAGKVEEEKVEVDSLIASYHKRLQTDELVRPCLRSLTLLFPSLLSGLAHASLYIQVSLSQPQPLHISPSLSWTRPSYEFSMQVALELQLLQVLRFHLHTCSPFRCFQGLMQDLHEVLLNHGSEEQTHDLLQQLHEGGLGVLCESYTSDAPFLFSPQQIALEALERAILSVSEGSSGAVEAMRAWLYRLSSDHGTLKPQARIPSETPVYCLSQRALPFNTRATLFTSHGTLHAYCTHTKRQPPCHSTLQPHLHTAPPHTTRHCKRTRTYACPSPPTFLTADDLTLFSLHSHVLACLQLDAIGNLRSSSMVNLADEATVHRLKQIDSRLRAVNKQIKRVIAERNQQEAKAAAIANAKREREKAQERAEGQRIMQQRLAEALRAHSPKCERDPGFIIKRRKTLPVEDGVKFESAGMSAIKEELKPKAEIKVENAP